MSGGLQTRCRGQSQISTMLALQSPPLEDHPLMMGAHPRRRCQENPLSIPNLQPHSQQIQGIHPPPQIYSLWYGCPPLCLVRSSWPDPFCFWYGHPNLAPKYYPLPPCSLEVPLIQSQGTLMRMAHIPFMNLIMHQIGIDNIPPIPNTLIFMWIYPPKKSCELKMYLMRIETEGTASWMPTAIIKIWVQLFFWSYVDFSFCFNYVLESNFSVTE